MKFTHHGTADAETTCNFMSPLKLHSHSLPMHVNSDGTKKELEAEDKLVNRLGYLAFFGVIAGLLIVAVYVFHFHEGLSNSPENWGQFGDYVGGLLNPVVGFLALIALLSTLRLQMRELRLSVQELRNSAEALEKQNFTLQKQTFEGTFFQTLRLHNDIVTAMVSPISGGTGRACFESLIDDFHGWIQTSQGDFIELDDCQIQLDSFFDGNQAELGHYFRLLYNLVKLVKNAEIEDKHFYTNMIRAQLSSAEVSLLFYNCLSEFGCEKFKPLVEEFSLLKTLPRKNLPDKIFLHAYSVEAYGGKYPVGISEAD